MIKTILCSVALAVGISAAGNTMAAELTSNDLIDCNVLIGGKNQTEYKKLINRLTRAAENGDIKSGLDLAGILNNRFVCFEDEINGDESWTVTVESADRTETTHRPTVKSLKKHPAAYSALQDVVFAYERFAMSSLSARALLGSFYARYHDALNKNEEGYLYIASVYEAECGRQPTTDLGKSRCRALKQDKMLYLPLLNIDRRNRLDQQAKDWASQYSLKSGVKQHVAECRLEETPLMHERACARFKVADGALNLSYKALMTELNKDASSILRTVQKTWIKWRDENCDQVNENSECQNSSCTGVAHDICIIDLTNQRTHELEEYSRNTEGARKQGFAFNRSYKQSSHGGL